MNTSHSGPGSVFDRFDQRVEETAFELLEIMRLPVVPCARREQRIEGRLPADERVRRHDVGDRLSEPAQLAPWPFRRPAMSPAQHMARISTSRPCHSAGRNGSGGALRMTAQQVRSSDAFARMD